MQVTPNVILKLEANPESVDRAASLLEKITSRYPEVENARLWLVGFDDDDRELDEIPEARKTLSDLAHKIGYDGIARFDRETALMFFVCLDLGGRTPCGKVWVYPEVVDFIDNWIP